MKRSQFLRAIPFLTLGAILLVPTEGEARRRKGKGKNKNNNKNKPRTVIRLKKPGEPSSIGKSKADLEKERTDVFDFLRKERLQPPES